MVVIDTNIMSAESGWVAIADTMRVLAAVGSYYNSTLENFSGAQPYDSWTINTSTNVWEAPVSKPSTHDYYQWDEAAYQDDNTNLIEDSKKNLIVMGRNTQLSIEDKNGLQIAIYKVPYGSKLFFKNDDKIKKNSKICEWDPYTTPVSYTHLTLPTNREV